MGPLLDRFAFTRRRREPLFNGQNCSVLLTDVTGFSAPDRTDEHRRIIRQAQYDILERSFKDSGVPWGTGHREDRGDGVLVVVGPDVSTELLVAPFIDSLFTRLSRYNAHADAATSLQLRAALHVGPVKSDPQGVTGEVIIRVSRLVESPVLKERLTEAKACLGFITSPFVFDSVIKQRPGRVDPADYEIVGFESKESWVTGWMYLGGGKSVEKSLRGPGRRR